MFGRRRRPVHLSPLGALLFVGVVAGCGAGAASPGPPSPATPTVTPGGTAVSQAEAVARVLGLDPRFAGIRPLDPDMVGQSAWYEVSPAAAGWRVTVTIGWGDCPSGCISRHAWVYDVDVSGTATLVAEQGDPTEEQPGGSSATPPVAIPGEGGPWIAGRASAGPVCPVERIPPDPACADRPVGGAVIVVRSSAGAEVARATTATDGTFLVGVPGGGAWTVVPQPVRGLLGTAAAVVVRVGDAPSSWAAVNVAYDTGIR